MPGNNDEQTTASVSGGQFNISSEETTRRLRAKGQPIRLFGETDKDRRLRLRALELIEERGGDKVAGQNDFRKALEDVEGEEKRKLERGGAATKSKGKAREFADTQVDLALVKTDPSKLYPIIYAALKQTLAEWGQWMDARPGEQLHRLIREQASLTFHIIAENVKRTMQGKIAAATQVQSGEYLKPLFKQLKARVSHNAVGHQK